MSGYLQSLKSMHAGKYIHFERNAPPNIGTQSESETTNQEEEESPPPKQPKQPVGGKPPAQRHETRQQSEDFVPRSEVNKLTDRLDRVDARDALGLSRDFDQFLIGDTLDEKLAAGKALKSAIEAEAKKIAGGTPKTPKEPTATPQTKPAASSKSPALQTGSAPSTPGTRDEWEKAIKSGSAGFTQVVDED